MRTAFTLALAGFVFACVSCRTAAPIDPMTMKPSDRCTPGAMVGESAK